SRAEDREVTLAELLTKEAGSSEVTGAITALAAPVVAASVAAVATLVRTGARLLSAISGTSIGVYRTSFLPHQRFGAGEPALRHASAGEIRAQDMSLAFEVVDTTPGGQP